MTSQIIHVEHLSKSFEGRSAVQDVTLSVDKSEIYGFLGPNGSGKTTTIRMLCGLLTPDAGAGHCLGFNILTESHKIKENVGYMTQRFSYYEDLSIYENLDFVARIYQVPERQKKVAETLNDLGLSHRKNQLAGELSGGWKQRLALAACLLHDPKLLLLDEPTAGVDPKARREFWDHIHRLRDQGITTLVSTHYMDEAERCTRLAYIAGGRILVTGTLSEVIASANLTMWHVTGQNLLSLAEELRQLPEVHSVVPFGQSLHVSGSDESVLKTALKPYQNRKSTEWSEEAATLEDVFIHYVSHAEGKE